MFKKLIVEIINEWIPLSDKSCCDYLQRELQKADCSLQPAILMYLTKEPFKSSSILLVHKSTFKMTYIPNKITQD
ncbi:hypothetical protein BIV59_09700 [Bacillus sp. MUM 13]|nr:hypothetical protein BIV59_09700 [Bacillus sp. MUM 13]